MKSMLTLETVVVRISPIHSVLSFGSKLQFGILLDTVFRSQSYSKYACRMLTSDPDVHNREMYLYDISGLVDDIQSFRYHGVGGIPSGV